jgi:hypothetical protein
MRHCEETRNGKCGGVSVAVPHPKTNERFTGDCHGSSTAQPITAAFHQKGGQAQRRYLLFLKQILSSINSNLLPIQKSNSQSFDLISQKRVENLSPFRNKDLAHRPPLADRKTAPILFCVDEPRHSVILKCFPCLIDPLVKSNQRPPSHLQKADGLHD